MDSAFEVAFRQWLSGEVTGHLGTYMYTEDSDDHRWKNGHSSPSYYVRSDEQATFDLVISDLDISTTNFFDLGPGGACSVKNKSKRLVESTKATRYFPVDLSYSLADEASNIIGLPGNPVITDFFEPLGISKPSSFVSLLGLTMGNFESFSRKVDVQARLSQILLNYRKAAPERSHLLVSIDANTNGNEIVNCYLNPEFGGLVRSGIERAINTDGFDYDVVWNPSNYQLATGLRSKLDQLIKWNGEEFAIESGQFLPVLNSYRFPVSFTIEAAAKAGWTHQKTWSKTGRVHYLLFA